MEDVRFDGLLQLQAAMQDMSGPTREGETQQEIYDNYHRGQELFTEWSTDQIWALHRMAFSLMIERAPFEPHRLVATRCMCGVFNQAAYMQRMAYAQLYEGDGHE